MSETDWEKRARDLVCQHWGAPDAETCDPAPGWKAMLQLGREMADARAAEIAAALLMPDRPVSTINDAVLRSAAIARSFISKPEPEYVAPSAVGFIPDVVLSARGTKSKVVVPDEAAIRTDEREKIVDILRRWRP